MLQSLLSKKKSKLGLLIAGCVMFTVLFYGVTCIQSRFNAEAHITIKPDNCLFCPALGDDPDYGGSGDATYNTALVTCQTETGEEIPIQGANVKFTYKYVSNWVDSSCGGTKDTWDQVDIYNITSDGRGLAQHVMWPVGYSVLEYRRDGLKECAAAVGHMYYPNSDAQVTSVPATISYGGKEYVVDKTVAPTLPGCSNRLLPYLSVSTTGTSGPGRPVCQYNDTTKTFSCNSAFIQTWNVQCAGGNGCAMPGVRRMFRMYLSPTAQTCNAGSAFIRSGWPMRTFNASQFNLWWSRAPKPGMCDGKCRSYHAMFMNLTGYSWDDSGVYSGVIELPYIVTSGTSIKTRPFSLPKPNYTTPFNQISNAPWVYDWVKDGSATPYTGIRWDTAVPVVARDAAYSEYVSDDTLLVPKFRYTCRPAAEPVVSSVKVYAAEAKDCPANNASCNVSGILTGNLLDGADANNPIYVGTNTNNDNPYRCSGQLNWSDTTSPTCNGTAADTQTVLDRNPYVLEVTVANNAASSSGLPWQKLGLTTVSFSANTVDKSTSDGNYLSFNFDPADSSAPVLCLQSNGASSTYSGTFQQCIDSGSSCQACAQKIGAPVTGVTYGKIADAGITFKYVVGYRDQWVNGIKNIFVKPTTTNGTLAPLSNEGWVLIDRSGVGCKYSSVDWQDITE